jgi:NAD(P)-dependent dehydrogenase (short-subunit alcohol dehydrogenase family)
MLTELAGRTAAVTGAASGIGLGIARRCCDRGMNVVMLDVEIGALREAAAGVGGDEHVLALQADVSDPDRMDEVAAEAYETFGAVHLLVNNAGVSLTGPLWEMTPKDWSWGVGVNLIGVANGIRSFGSRMVAGGEEGHIVSTSSLAGLTPMPHAGVYSATKAAVVALSEVLYHDLQAIDSKVGVSVLCPGLVNTNILKSVRNRPFDASESADVPIPEEAISVFQLGDTPEDVADRVLRAVENDDFYILTGEGGRADIAARSKALVELSHPPRPNPGSIMPDSFGKKG